MTCTMFWQAYGESGSLCVDLWTSIITLMHETNDDCCVVKEGECGDIEHYGDE